MITDPYMKLIGVNKAWSTFDATYKANENSSQNIFFELNSVAEMLCVTLTPISLA